MKNNAKYLIICIIAYFITSGNLDAQDFSKKALKKERAQREATRNFTEGVKYYILEDYDKALRYFEKSLDEDAKNAAAHFKIAKIYHKKEELNKALKVIDQAINLKGDNKFFYHEKADILTQQSNFKEAAKVYEKIAEKFETSPDLMFELAAIYLYQKEYKKAIEQYNKAEKKFGVQPEIIKQKQKIYLKQNKLQEAVEESKKLIKAFPGEDEHVVSLAEIFINNNKPGKAIPFLEEFIEKNPNSPRPRLILGKIYENQGKFKKAHNHFKFAFNSNDLNFDIKVQLLAKFISDLPDGIKKERDSIQLRNNSKADVSKLNLCYALAASLEENHPEQGKTYAVYGDLLRGTGNPGGARNKYLKATQLGQNSYNIWQNILSIEFRDLNEMDSVAKHSSQALETYPNQASLYFFKGSAELSLKNYDKAVDALEQGLNISGQGNRFLFTSQLGDAYYNLEEYDKAFQFYEKALQDRPGNTHVKNNYSYYLSLQNRNLDKALKMSKDLVKQHPDNPTYLDTHAWVLYQAGNYEEAKKYLERAVDAGTDSGIIIEHYGDVLFKLGMVNKAVEQWKKAKGMDETSDNIDKKIANRKLYE